VGGVVRRVPHLLRRRAASWASPSTRVSPVAYAWALSIILLTWGLAWLYGRVSARSLDPLAERAAAQVERETFVDRPAPGREPVGDQEPSRR
jgi:hypothetical protein